MPLSVGHYLRNMSKLTDQWTRHNYKEPERQRIYLKDVDCPQVWHDKLKEQIPPSLFYLNDSTGAFGGPGSIDEQTSSGPGPTKGQGVARAGDLMSCLPPNMRAENMMCYIGHEGTYTPAHREMCASLGQNLMVETSGVVGEDGKPTKPGSSIWFMTETNDRHLVSEYWLSTLGHDIEVEAHFAQINAWKAAPFKTYIVEQKAGDFILIPPLAPHQVWNRGTRTMKAAWNRTTVETLEMALHEALPRARIVCRDEQYKNKAIVYFTLEKYSGLLKRVDKQKRYAAMAANPQDQAELTYGTKIRQLQKDFRRLFSLYTEIMLSEMLSPVSPTEKKGQYLPFDSFVTCSYCRCNIFNRFLTCPSCVAPLPNGEEDTYDVCMECYTMGRSCSCLSKYKWVEQFPWQTLVQKHETWRHQIIEMDGLVTEKSPQPLQTARNNLGRKTLAQVCQEQLKARPWNDPTKPTPAKSSWERHHPWEAGMDQEQNEVQVDVNGNLVKSKSKKSRADRLPKGFVMEHVSHYPEERWKVASCNKCDKQYSYGSLFRMFDLMPLTVMENPDWECPHCRKICSAGKCRKLPGMKPYEPSGTVLGVDTKKVADPRSVESLVNFSLPNIPWIKKAGDDHPQENRRLSRRRDEAAKAKSKDPTLNEHYVDEEDGSSGNNEDLDSSIKYTTEPDIPVDPMLIDPMLTADQPMIQTGSKAKNRVTDGDHTESSSEAPIESRVWHSVTNFLSGKDATPSSNGLRGSDGLQKGRNTTNGSHLPGRTSGAPRGQPANEAIDHRESNDQRLAPPATMNGQHDQGQNFISNGITYEYPDPTASTPNTTFPSNNYYHPNKTADSSQKRSDARILQSDLPPLPGEDSNEQYRQAQTYRTLQTAKRNDRYISAEAAITGKRLRITMPISGEKLAAMSNGGNLSHDTNRVIKEPPILLQSDLPLSHSTPQFIEIPKKKRVRKEDDHEFRTRKRSDRRSDIARPVLAKDLRKKTTKYTEISSESEASAQDESLNAFVPVNKTKGPRPLPKYLAQRSEGDQVSSSDDLLGRKPLEATKPDTLHTVVSGRNQEEHDSHSLHSAPSPQATLTTNNHVDQPRLSSPASESVRDDHLNESPGSIPQPAATTVPETRLAPALITSPVDPTLQIAEDNRKAKMKAIQWDKDEKVNKSSDSDSDSDSSSSSGDQQPITATKPTSKLLEIPKSMFSRPGMAGKKVKVVAATKRGRGRPRRTI